MGRDRHWVRKAAAMGLPRQWDWTQGLFLKYTFNTFEHHTDVSLLPSQS